MKGITESKPSTFMDQLLWRISESIDILIEQEQSHHKNNSQCRNKPSHLWTNTSYPRVSSNNLNGRTFTELTDKTYNERVKWRRNLFLVPTGNKGNKFFSKLAYWLEQSTKKLLSVFMVLPNSILQKLLYWHLNK